MNLNIEDLKLRISELKREELESLVLTISINPYLKSYFSLRKTMDKWDSELLEKGIDISSDQDEKKFIRYTKYFNQLTTMAETLDFLAKKSGIDISLTQDELSAIEKSIDNTTSQSIYEKIILKRK